MKQMALINGKLYVKPGVFAQAALCGDGVIRQVGTTADILAAAGDAQVVDCGGRTVIPGLNDSHMHLLGVGVGMYEADITGVRSIDELVERVRAYRQRYPERCAQGIHAVGWNQDLFTGETRIPDRHDLDRVATDIPVVLERICGHVATGNSRVVELLGLTKASPQYTGGTWERDAQGEPSGVFTENGCGMAVGTIPGYSREAVESMFLQAAEYALSRGVTSVQSNDAGTSWASRALLMPLLKELYEQGRCKLRYRYQISFESPAELREFCADEQRFARYETDRLKLGPVKLFKDGSLGGRTALMRQDYLDDAGNRGITVMDRALVDEYCRAADENGMQVVTHVIGDRAVEETLESYETVLHEGKNPLRHGLIHCQITDLPLLQRMVRDQVPAFYQPIFLDYDMHAVVSRCGEALSSTSYAFRTLEKLGGRVSYGTDSPVEDCDPFPNLYSAVTRKDKTGWPEGGFFPAERVSVEQAVDAYTVGSAWAEFQEDTKGRIAPGFLADFAVLDRDIFTCDPMEIRTIRPVMTIVAGEVVFEK